MDEPEPICSVKEASEIYNKDKSIETESRLMVARLGSGGIGSDW